MKVKCSILCVLLMSFALCGALPLARNGKPAAQIVLPSGSDETLGLAAEELQTWIFKISGAKLPVVNSVSATQAQIILDPASTQFPDDAAQFNGNDGYSVRQKGNKVYINAGKSKGVLNGVYRMLFKNSDIIWARPNPEFGTVYSTDANFTLKNTDYIDIPKYILRGWQINSRSVSDNWWQIRNATNWNSLDHKNRLKHKWGTIMEFGGGHNIVGKYIREKKYFRTHPEFFPLKNGKRMRPSEHKASVQLCFTNAEMVKAFIKELDALVKANPQYTTYRIMIEDNYNLCECEACMKDIVIPEDMRFGKKAPSPVGISAVAKPKAAAPAAAENPDDDAVVTVGVKDKAFRSTQFFIFLNQIGRHFKTHYPGKRILTFAYIFTVIPPKCKLEDNIDISFCPIGKNSKYPLTAPQSKRTMDQFMRWTKITRNVTWREYFGLCGDFPRPIDVIALADWKYAHQYGVIRTYSEMRADRMGRNNITNSWDTNSLYFWVITQGCWDPYQDVKALRMEFLNRVYGAEAAPHIAEYYRLIEEQWFKLPGSSKWNDVPTTNWQNYVIHTGIGNACRAALKRAEGKVKPNGRKHFELLKANLEKHLAFEVSKVVIATRTGGKPDFDPDFNSASWTGARIADQFFWNTSLKPHPDRTEVRVLYDDNNIYIGLKCEVQDVKKMLYRKYVKGEKVFPYGEGFEIFLVGNWKSKINFAQIATDPAGNRYFGGRRIKWQNQCRITDSGWSALITIPWTELNCTPGTVKSLPAQFIRQYMKPKKPGMAPWRAAIMFSGKRRIQKTFTKIEFK